MNEFQKIVPNDLRKIILEILKSSPELQFIALERAAKTRAADLGFSPLKETDHPIVQEVIWDLKAVKILKCM